jgi:hypothetical protein
MLLIYNIVVGEPRQDIAGPSGTKAIGRVAAGECVEGLDAGYSVRQGVDEPALIEIPNVLPANKGKG